MALSTQRDSAFLPSPDQSAPQPNYDVFLSFRGEDTRLSFVSHLYHELQLRGIKTFKDDPKLERGTAISSGLFNAIQESMLAIVVLSPKYASSTWCLDELTEILQCMKSKGTILPVFYNVDPSHVRKQSGTFADAFAEHEKRFREDIDKVKSWRDALTEVANLSGIDSKNECERKLIENIVEWVWEKVHRRFKLLGSTELVGMKFIREQVDLLLAHPTDDVRFVGIWGMGGIGKTTIAKLVYDRISIHYEVKSFLANVREVSQRGDLVNLQRQLLSPILKDQFTQVWDEQWGTSVIKNCLYNKKVLLILDDVSESSQLEKLAGEKDWFGKGSIIIITTRDKRLLVKHDIHISCKVEALGNDDALVLFSLNAFKKKEPEEGFLELSKGFVSYARGLPLALKLLGCLVYKRDQYEWKSELDKLQKIPNSEIIDLLKISYDGLDEMNKDIFLDVAFFHKGMFKERVIEILDCCGLYGHIGINALVQKSLLTIDISNNTVEMHDLIQEMALEIVRRECSEEPGRRSRLCNRDDISHVFINNTATYKIKGIALRMARLEMADWNCEAFSKMCNLKVLEFDNVIISSSPRIIPNSLRIIKWSRYPSKFLPSSFQPNFLIALKMRESKLVRLWDGRKVLQISIPGRKIPEWFSDQSSGDSLTVELPTTWMGIALCAVFEVQAHLSDFEIICSGQELRPHGVFSKYFEVSDVVSDHLWVIYVSRKQVEKICGQIKVLFRTYYSQDMMRGDKKSCVKKCGFRLVHEQDVEQLNQIMMNKSIIKSSTTYPTNSVDAQGQHRHDDEEAGPSGSGSSHQKSLFCNTYALSEEADQDELNDDDVVVDEARPRKRKKIDVIGTNL